MLEYKIKVRETKTDLMAVKSAKHRRQFFGNNCLAKHKQIVQPAGRNGFDRTANRSLVVVVLPKQNHFDLPG